MAQVTITQLPQAGALDGTELVPIVQNGVTVHTTTGDIAAQPAQQQTFLTVDQETTLPNSRYLAADTGITLSDGGAESFLKIGMDGAAASLNAASNGIVVKTGASTVTPRSIASTSGISVANADGVSGNPTISLDGIVESIENIGSGNGFFALNGTTALLRQMYGTANQVDVANGNGTGNPTISLADNPVVPGTQGITVPAGTNAERPVSPNDGEIRYNTDINRLEAYVDGAWNTMGVGDGTVTSVSGTAGQIDVANGSTTPVVSITSNPTIPGTASIKLPAGGTADRPVTPVNGMMRYNTDSLVFEGYINGAWTSFASAGIGVISVNTGTGLTGGPITSSGTISIANTGVTAGSYTAANITVNAQGQITTASSNTSIVSTFSAGTTGFSPSTPTTGDIVLGGFLFPASGGTGAESLTGYVYGNGTTAMTASTTIPTTDLSGTISNAQLANSSVTVGTTNIPLGSTSLTLGGLTSVAVTQDPTTALQLATKQYVDTVATTGIDYHTPVYVEVPNTFGNLNATYNNGAAGVGATLTNAGTQAAFTADGISVPLNSRVLVYNQTNAVQNGVYTLTTVGDGSTNWVLTRATDANSYGVNDPQKLDQGSTFFVTNGNTGAGETYTCNTVGVITFGTTPITFTQIASSQIYSAGNGLTLTGTQFSLTAPVTAVNGGSGQTSYTTGDLLYASNSTTLTKLGIGTDGYALRSSAGVPAWQLLATYFPITLHSGTTVTDIPIANGYFPVLLHNGVTSVNVTCY